MLIYESDGVSTKLDIPDFVANRLISGCMSTLRRDGIVYRSISGGIQWVEPDGRKRKAYIDA